MKLKKYSKYKQSGIDWIGEIPVDWEIRKLKYILGTIQSGNRETGGGGIHDDGIISLGGEHVNWDGTITYNTNKLISEEYYNKLNQGKVKEGDTLLVKDGATIGKTAFLDRKPFKKLAVNEHVFLMRPNSKFDSKLLYYQICSDLGFQQIKLTETGSAQGGINLGFPDKVLFPVTLDIQTQQKISSFLDSKTTQIEKLIKKDKKIIELLKEKRVSLINRAVTKGLDYSVKMKDSGVEWIGEIPGSWEVNKIKHLLKMIITDGPHETPEFLDDGIPFISAEAIKNNKIDFNYKRGYISLKEHKRYSLKSKPQLNDVFMIKSGSTTGNIAMVETDEEFNIWSPLALMRVNEKIKAKLFFYNLMSFYFKEQVKLGWSFGTQENIGMGVIQNLDIITPKDIEEQEVIVNFIDKETQKIDNHINKVEKRIELYEEYKKSLIYNVVTGKVEV